MGKKQKHPEHVNLERWLISYADFITLLFATFVVLYALSQVDIKDFKALEDSIQKAFSAPSIMQGDPSIMENSSNSIFDSSQADSMITPLMMEYISQKYEQQAMQEMQSEIDKNIKNGELDGVEAISTNDGLVIRFKGDYLFSSGSAQLNPHAKKTLDKIGVIIAKKFILHNMRIEGHTDNQPMSSKIYPSNWELSSARAGSIIRYFTKRFNFMPSLFTSVGFADTRPIANNSYAAGRNKNRRVEIVILKNRFNSSEDPQNEILKMSKEEQAKMQADRISTISRIEGDGSFVKSTESQNAANLNDKQDAVVLNNIYENESKRLSHQTNAFDKDIQKKITGKGDWLKPPAPVDINHVGNVKVFK